MKVGDLPRGWLSVAIATLGVWALAGCVTETRPITDNSPPPRASSPRSVGPAPANVRATQMLIVAGVPSDADSNGFPDTVPVVVYLFAPAGVYPLPLTERGVFEFRLTAGDGTLLGEWVFAEDVVAGAAQPLPPGNGFIFGLRVAKGSDRVANQAASVTAVFRPADGGRPVLSTGSATVRMGSGIATQP
jgi:hypothetical protein